MENKDNLKALLVRSEHGLIHIPMTQLEKENFMEENIGMCPPLLYAYQIMYST